MKTSFSDGDELDILADRISKEADTEEKKKILAEYSSSILKQNQITLLRSILEISSPSL